MATEISYAELEAALPWVRFLPEAAVGEFLERVNIYHEAAEIYSRKPEIYSRNPAA